MLKKIFKKLMIIYIKKSASKFNGREDKNNRYMSLLHLKNKKTLQDNNFNNNLVILLMLEYYDLTLSNNKCKALNNTNVLYI